MREVFRRRAEFIPSIELRHLRRGRRSKSNRADGVIRKHPILIEVNTRGIATASFTRVRSGDWKRKRKSSRRGFPIISATG